jgi:AsmA protein
VQKDRFDIAAFARSRRRAALWATGALVLVAFFLYVIVPFVASTRIVKDRIAFELSVWSGYQVSIGSDPTIRLFPFRAVLNDVKLTEWTRPGPPVLTAEQVSIYLSPVAALMGDIAFDRARLAKPVLRVEDTASGLYLPRLPGGGRMANAVKDAQVLAAQNPDEPDLSSLRGDPFGRVEFSNGRILDVESDEEIVTALQGVISWPRLDSTGSLQASGTWRGESVNIDLSSSEPMLLMAGGTARTHIAFAGAPGNATFDGTLNLSQKPFFEGQGAFSTSSLRRMLEWSRADLNASPEVNVVSMRGHLQGDAERIKLEDLQLTLDGSAGTGALDLLLNQPRPAISGTLAFQQINLNSFIASFTPGAASSPGDANDIAFTERFDLDVRMSAAQATMGSVALSEVAATAQIRDGLAVFDISDARAFDGSIQAGMRFDHKADGIAVEASVRAADIDGGAFGSAMGLARAIPVSRGSFSLLLKGPVKRWDHFTDELSGSLHASFGAGTLSGFDLSAFLAKAREGGFFPLSDVAQGMLTIDRLDLRTTINDNVAHLERADIRAGQNSIRLSGIISYAGRGLALSGAVLSNAQTDAAGQRGTNFFVGGTWSEPFISPTATQRLN